MNLAVTLPTLPGGDTAFISFTQTSGTATGCDDSTAVTPAPATISCAIGSLPALGVVEYQLRVRLPQSGAYPSTATVTSDNDNNPGNNTQNQTTTVNNAADLVASARAVSDGVDVTSVPAGKEFEYRLGITNQGPYATEAGGTIRTRFTIPAGVVARAVPAGTGWTCTPNSGFPLPAGTEFTCERSGELAVSDSAPEISVPVVANVATDPSNIAAAFAVDAFRANGLEMPDPDLTNNNAVVNLSTTDGSDLAITKARSPSGVIEVGQTVTFTLTPRFNGGLAPTGTLTVTDTLDPLFTAVTITGAVGWDCSGSSGNDILCTRTDGATFTNHTDLPQIVVTATAPATTADIPNTAEIEAVGGHPDPEPDNNTSSAATSVSNEADLRVAKSASINPVLIGQDFNYTIGVTNAGPLAIPAGQTVTVTDTPPAGMTLFPAGSTSPVTVNGWSCASSTGSFPLVGNGVSALTCTRSGLGVTTSNIAVPAQLTQQAALTNEACAALSAGTIVNPVANDCGDVLVTASGTTAQGADLEVVSKTATPNPVRSGENLTYVITVRNNSATVAATNVRVTDQLESLMPTGGLQSITPSQGTCTPNTLPADGASQTVSCELGSLLPLDTATIQIVVRPRIAATGDRTNTARIWSADIGDPNHSNNEGSVTSTVEAVAALSITKQNTPDPVRAGEPVTYVVTVHNDGPSTAAGVTMTDTLPDNAAFVGMVVDASCTPPAVDAVGGELSCAIGDIASGGQRAVSYRVRPLALPQGQSYAGYVMTNVAEANTTTLDDNGDPHPTVSATTETEVTEPELDVLINKSDTPDPVTLGQTVRYTIRVENDGPSYATNAVMTDVFPAPGSAPTAVFSYQGNLVVSGGGVCDEPAAGAIAGTLVCRWPGLVSGVSQTVSYDMIAEAITTPGEVTGTGFNAATIEVDEEETTLANNSVQEDTTARRDAVATDLALTKVSDRDIA